MRRVFIADEHPLFRRGVAAVLDPLPDLSVCGETGENSAIYKGIEETHPHIVTLDLRLHDGDGLALIAHLGNRYPDLPLLVISSQSEDVYATRSLRAGARGYVAKHQNIDTVLTAIRQVLRGETYLSPSLEAQLAGRYVRGRTLAVDTPEDTLSDRELQAYRLIGSGRTTREIAATLCVSTKTIESHRCNIKKKLGVRATAQLVYRATQWVVAMAAAGPIDRELPETSFRVGTKNCRTADD